MDWLWLADYALSLGALLLTLFVIIPYIGKRFT